MTLEEIIQTYNSVVKVVDKQAQNQEDRAYGGFIREIKGHLQEYITKELVKYTWQKLGGKTDRLEINSKKIKIPIKMEYVNNLKDEEVKKYILDNIDSYYYRLSIDKHVFIDGKFVAGIKCKAYTENAMIKRIMIDFWMLKKLYPDLHCFLFQLESQLGGDYSKLNNITYGSKPTHSIMSYFPEVDLNIFTFLRGERKIDEPIHKYFKELGIEQLKNAVKLLENCLKRFLS